MVEIPEELRAVFTTTVEEADDTYRLEIPASEIQQDALAPGDTCRVAVLNPIHRTPEPASQPEQTDPQDGPPVEEGDIREVTISSVGDQGDGIAKIEQGFVVIVPGTSPGEQPTVEIEHVRPNVAFAAVDEPEPQV